MKAMNCFRPACSNVPFHGRLDRFGTGVGEEHLLLVSSWTYLAKAFCQLGLDIIIIIGSGKMHELCRLVLYCLYTLG